jgi:uncharacterized protein YggT (Ycf19 family)
MRKPQQGFVGMLAGLASLLFGIIVGILAFRFVFRLLGANPANGIVNWVYNASAPLVSPFFGMFNTAAIDLGIGRLEFETLIAILVYGVIGSIITRALSGGTHRYV